MSAVPKTPRDWLLLALSDYGIVILEDKGQFLTLEKEYTVEIERNGIYKLLWKGKIVAPFADLNELCQFICVSS